VNDQTNVENHFICSIVKDRFFCKWFDARNEKTEHSGMLFFIASCNQDLADELLGNDAGLVVSGGAPVR